MRIKKIHIIKYGPINDLDLDIGPGLQIIRGRNETGKTLAIEAVIKMLLEGKTRDFDDIDRVIEQPEGYILFEDKNGTEQKVNIKSGLAKHMDLGGLDLRNIFIIRDSDLTLRDECGYYKNITDKLTGLQLEKIDTLMSAVQDFGRLVKPSSDARLANSMKYGKIDSLRSQALSFEQEGREYLKYSGEEKLDYLELEQVNTRQKINNTRERIKTAEKINEWDKFKKYNTSLEQLKKQWKTYIEYRDFDQDNYEKLSGLIINIDSTGGKISEAARDQEKNTRQRTKLEEKLVKVQGKLDILEAKKRDIDRLRSDLEIYSRRKAEEVREPERFSRIITVILLLLAPLSFPAVYIPTQNIFYSFILPVLLLIAGIVIFVVNRSGIKADRFAAEGSLLENEFKKIGFKIKNLDDVMPLMAEFEDSFREVLGERNSLSDHIRLMEMEEKRISEILSDGTRDRKSLQLEMDEVMAGLDIKDIKEFNTRRKIKNRAVSEIMAIAKTLRDVSDTGPDDHGLKEDPEDITGEMDNIINRWEEKIAASKPQGDPPSGEDKKIGHRQLEDMRLKLEELEQKENDLNLKLEDHRKTLNDFQRRFAAMDLSRYLDNFIEFDITNLERLREASDLAENFINLIDHQYNTSVEAIKIFESIKNREETKISDLFKRLEISEIFRDITEDKYTDVKFDSQAGKVIVIDGYGKELPAENLSKGAYDQLFLSIRIAISEEILGDGNGFFIIDDAFLSSDSGRLARQFKVLKRLADRGWSIVYFSVKDEVAGLSEEFTKNKIIEMS